jgi:hypothetical protein
MDGADGQTGGKIEASLLYCLHSFPLASSMFLNKKAFVGFPARPFFGVIHRVRFKNNLPKSTLAFNVG